jgi:hypothetical protein
MDINATSGTPQGGYQKVKNDFQALSQALASGNLASAQKAYASIQDDQKNGPQPPANSPIANDFAALGDALKSGDIAGAQQAFSSLQTDVQTARQSQVRGGHGGGPGGGGGGGSQGTDNSQKTVASQVSTTNANGTITVTIIYTDGTTSATTQPNPNPVVSSSPLTSNNPGQLATLLTAQEQSAFQPEDQDQDPLSTAAQEQNAQIGAV